MATNAEELYLEAEGDIRNQAYAEALRKFDSILYDEPNHAPSHNSMGWIYKNQLDDFAKAEVHFLASIRSNPQYPHPYFHMATLLTDTERYAELDRHLALCLTIPTIEKSWVYNKRGLMEELRMNFEAAIRQYEQAILTSLYDDKIKEYRENIERCRQKLEIQKGRTES